MLGEFRQNSQLPAHSFNVVSQSGKKKVAALLQLGNLVLPYSKAFCKTLLG